MKHFTSVNDVSNVSQLIAKALELKKQPFDKQELGKNKTIGLLFFNSSLRTRLSTQKAASNLGMNVIIMNIGAEGWALEMEDGTLMNGSGAEHIKDAAAVLGLYCSILAVRCFPTLINKEEDYSEKVLQSFIKYSGVPVVSMESATLHPLQSLADMMTISETMQTKKPKVVLTWAPHYKALPQAVANSFAEWTLKCGYDLTIVHPKGYELCSNFTQGATILYDQQAALKEADFVYVKNWASYTDYGKVLNTDTDWMLTPEKMEVTNKAKIMHCLPVRRNLEVSDAVLDGPNSLILKQALNREFAAQVVLQEILEANF
jgi:N-succinyl-L-ornithine transcarbamylase